VQRQRTVGLAGAQRCARGVSKWNGTVFEYEVMVSDGTFRIISENSSVVRPRRAEPDQSQASISLFRRLYYACATCGDARRDAELLVADLGEHRDAARMSSIDGLAKQIPPAGSCRALASVDHSRPRIDRTPARSAA